MIYSLSCLDPSPVDPQPSGGTLAQQSVGAPSTQSQFHVDDINTSSLAGLYTHLQLNPQVCIYILLCDAYMSYM